LGQRMYKKITALLCLLLAFGTLAYAEEDFLRPDQAFAISANAVGQDKVRVTWQIADGYYMYQSKFRFSAENPAITFGEPVMPAAIEKNDPVFGLVQIYRKQVSVDVPIEKVPPNTDVMTLKARSQGCADKGLCYPPHTQTILVALNPRADAPIAMDSTQVEEIEVAGSSPEGGALPILEADPLAELQELGDELGLGAMEDDILSPEQAFQVSAESPDGNTLNVRWTIADGTYLYQDKLKVEVLADGVELGKYDMPTPDIKKDSVKPDGTFGDVPVYHEEVVLQIPLLRTNTGATDIEVKTGYQGCADRGICYPPQKSTLRVSLPAAEGASGVASSAPPATATSAAAVPVNEQDELLGDLQTASPLLGLLLSLGFGVLVAFTACMYPMIPILSSLIMGQGEKITAFRSFELSFAYTQGIALTFGVIGAFIALFGQGINIQSALQTPWVLVPSAILFVALALSMFGFYQIQMPSSIQSRLHEMSNSQKGGSLFGVFLMGVLSALIVGPCGGPVLLAVLAFAAQTQDMLLGFLFLWVFGTGMGLPLLIMGSGGGALLPKAGTWMDTVKATGGVIMLALAISFLERLSPTYIGYSTIMLMWGTLMIVTGIYMGALRSLPEATSGWSKLWKGLGLVILVYGVLFLIGVAAGGKDTWQPLKGISMGGGHAAVEQQHAQFTRVKTIEDLDREVAAAAAAGKPVMLDFYADWCTYCKTMEKEVFPHPTVVAALEDFVLLQADITRQDDNDIALSKHLDMPAPPALYFWNEKGEEMRSHRILGNVTAQQLASRAVQVTQ